MSKYNYDDIPDFSKNNERYKKMVERYEAAKKKSANFDESDYDFDTTFIYDPNNNAKRKRILNKVRIIAISVIVAICLSVSTKLFIPIIHQQKVKHNIPIAETIARDEAREFLSDNHLYTFGDIGKDMGNDYSLIEITDDDIFGYYCFFGLRETEVILRYRGFDSLNDFLKLKGYVDENGNPSINEFKMSETEKMMEEGRIK